MMRWHPDTQIGRVRVHGGADRLPERNHLEFLLGGADLRPRGLPPGAILVIRDLTDPLPGRFREHRSSLRVASEWEVAAQTRLDEVRRIAARPGPAAAPLAAPAVLFTDPAELLACLALDLARGEASAKWWWQVIRRSLPADLARVLAENAVLVPAVFDALDTWGVADIVLGALPPGAGRLLLDRVAQVFGAPLLAATSMFLDAAALRAPERGYPEHAGTPSEATDRLPVESAVEARLAVHRWFARAASVSEVDLERAVLHGVVRALFAAPALARSSAFALEVRQWCRCQRGPQDAVSPASPLKSVAAARPEGTSIPRAVDGSLQPETPPRSPEDLAGLSKPTQQRAANHAGTKAPDRAAWPPALGLATSSAAAPMPVASPSSARTPEPSSLGQASELPPQPRPAEVRPSVSEGSTPDRLPAAGAQSGRVETDAAPSDFDSTLTEIVTELGGAFYLVNALAWLDPPGTLPRWGLLEAFVRALLPDHAFAEDPIWAVLHSLDHRAWDAPPTPHAVAWIAEQVPPIRPRLGAIAAECSPSPPSQADAEFAFAGLLLHRARVLVTRSRVDVLFRLDQIALPLRRAGLDRDPGWRPDFGRIIRFHFD